MTPIKVGAYTVVRAAECDCHRYAIDAMQGTGFSQTLPMALVIAAKAAGIQRQRVRWVRDLRLWATTAPQDKPSDTLDSMLPLFTEEEDWRDLDPYDFQSLGNTAHKYARERYAALGGAA